MNGFGWTWDEFCRTPKMVVDLMVTMQSVDAYVERWRQEEQEATAKK